MDERDSIIAVENWKSLLKRDLDFCQSKVMTPVDITSFAE
jgi:hypothetical protein